MPFATPSFHILDLIKPPIPGCLQNGPHVLFHEIGIEGNGHIPQLHIELGVFGRFYAAFNVVSGNARHIAQAGRKIEEFAELSSGNPRV